MRILKLLSIPMLMTFSFPQVLSDQIFDHQAFKILQNQMNTENHLDQIKTLDSSLELIQLDQASQPQGTVIFFTEKKYKNQIVMNFVAQIARHHGAIVQQKVIPKSNVIEAHFFMATGQSVRKLSMLEVIQDKIHSHPDVLSAHLQYQLTTKSLY